jgi:hypothetical protein
MLDDSDDRPAARSEVIEDLRGQRSSLAGREWADLGWSIRTVDQKVDVRDVSATREVGVANSAEGD